MAPESELDCVACGACCFSRALDYVPLSGADHARLPADRYLELEFLQLPTIALDIQHTALAEQESCATCQKDAGQKHPG